MDTLNVTILPDGTIRTEVIGHVTAPNHARAEAFLAEVTRLSGGEVQRTKRGHAHHHHHHEQEVKQS